MIATLNEAVDQVRRTEQKDNPRTEEHPVRVVEEPGEPDREAGGTLTWLTRPSMQLATGRAHRWREDFQEFSPRPSAR